MLFVSVGGKLANHLGWKPTGSRRLPATASAPSADKAVDADEASGAVADGDALQNPYVSIS
jgi:hypothetical protein